MKLHDINEGIHKNKKRRRIGRGPGSGWGKTAGRGHNGQKSRSGWSQKRLSRVVRCQWFVVSRNVGLTIALRCML